MTTSKPPTADPNALLDPLVLERMLLAVDPVDPSPDRAEGLRARVLSIARPTALAPGAPTSDAPLVTIRAGEGDWLLRAPGVEMKVLHETPQSRSVLFRLSPGGVLPPHGHIGEEECIVLSGSIHIGSQLVSEGDFHLASAGTDHRPITTTTGALLYVRNGREARA